MAALALSNTFTSYEHYKKVPELKRVMLKLVKSIGKIKESEKTSLITKIAELLKMDGGVAFLKTLAEDTDDIIPKIMEYTAPEPEPELDESLQTLAETIDGIFDPDDEDYVTINKILKDNLKQVQSWEGIEDMMINEDAEFYDLAKAKTYEEAEEMYINLVESRKDTEDIENIDEEGDPPVKAPAPAPPVKAPAPAPPVKALAPPAKAPAPPVKALAPPAKAPAPPVKDPAPPVKDPAPPVKDPAPSVKDPAPPVKDPAPPVKDPAPPAKAPVVPIKVAKVPAKLSDGVEALISKLEVGTIIYVKDNHLDLSKYDKVFLSGSLGPSKLLIVDVKACSDNIYPLVFRVHKTLTREHVLEFIVKGINAIIADGYECANKGLNYEVKVYENKTRYCYISLE